MKNPFKKHNKNNALLIAGIIGGAVAAGLITALIIRNRHALADAAKDAKVRATDYLNDKKQHLKKHKTDVHELADIISHA